MFNPLIYSLKNKDSLHPVIGGLLGQLNPYLHREDLQMFFLSFYGFYKISHSVTSFPLQIHLDGRKTSPHVLPFACGIFVFWISYHYQHEAKVYSFSMN
ncbi:hypothetical protein A6R68_01895, partial [Neotoma lepida]